MKEQDIQRAILDLLAVKARGGGLWFSKVPLGPMKVGNSFAAPNPMRGFPDILCIYHGHAICIEVKYGSRGKHKYADQEHQASVHTLLRAAGATVLQVDSPDLVAAFFGEYDAQAASEQAAAELRKVWT